MQFVRFKIFIVMLSLVVGCAGGSTDDNDNATSGPQDAGEDGAAGPDAQDDSGAPDTGPEDAGPEDVGEDADACGVCCPGERTCLTEDMVGVCDDDGSQHTEEPCGDGQICEDATCVDEPVCDAGETRCHDGTTRLICRGDESGWRTETCGSDEACLSGECVTGAPNGAECADDDDCAGGKCRCGSAESCSPTPSRTYCTATCTPGSCGPDEVCVDSEAFDGASYDHCVPSCDQSCPISGLTCASVPTRDSGELDYARGCTLDTAVDIGEECTSETNCTGTTCFEDHFDFGICTFECSGNCPDGTSCVQLEGGTYHCSPNCGDGSPGNSEVCPLDPDGDDLKIDCEVRTDYDGSARYVCVST